MSVAAGLIVYLLCWHRSRRSRYIALTNAQRLKEAIHSQQQQSSAETSANGSGGFEHARSMPYSGDAFGDMVNVPWSSTGSRRQSSPGRHVVIEMNHVVRTSSMFEDLFNVRSLAARPCCHAVFQKNHAVKVLSLCDHLLQGPKAVALAFKRMLEGRASSHVASKAPVCLRHGQAFGSVVTMIHHRHVTRVIQCSKHSHSLGCERPQ